VPFAVFAAISGQVTASSWAVLGGAVALTNLTEAVNLCETG
jgi:hypothetical protein